jgi:hypothetical protein
MVPNSPCIIIIPVLRITSKEIQVLNTSHGTLELKLAIKKNPSSNFLIINILVGELWAGIIGSLNIQLSCQFSVG